MKERVSRYIGLAGILCLIVGFVQYAARFDSRLAFAIGLLALFVYAIVNFREVVALGRRRSARHGANAVLMVVFFTAILVLIQAISLRHGRQLDTTRNARFSLAPQTLEVLRGLESDVEIHAFFRRSSSVRPNAEELLTLYANHAQRLRYEFVDPDKRPTVADEMGARYNEIVVSTGGRRRVVNEITEEALTNALLGVTRDQYKAVYFVTGHGEKQLDAGDRGGYASLKRGLQNDGYTVRPLSLLDAQEIPLDCEVLVVAGPRKTYLEAETGKISDYLERGGSVMFLIDPRVELPEIETILAGYNIVLDPIVLLDELVVIDSGDRKFDATVTKIRRYEEHPITRGLNAITMYPMARTVRITEEERDYKLSAQYLAATEESAWGETDMESIAVGRATRDGVDIAPPLPIAAVVVKEPLLPGIGAYAGGRAKSKIVVFGDSDFVNNAFYGLLGNSDLFLNSINFLSGDESFITVRPRKGLGDRVFITASQGRFIFALCLILLPLSVVTVGTTVFVKKRKN